MVLLNLRKFLNEIRIRCALNLPNLFSAPNFVCANCQDKGETGVHGPSLTPYVIKTISGKHTCIFFMFWTSHSSLFVCGILMNYRSHL